ncbi:hypothetical protein KCP70_02310 [Salmonella enterica subsp. enterica]|nr:hypothetical protein KCP70_02310 [Salmonella enterica subsp. enterica]
MAGVDQSPPETYALRAASTCSIPWRNFYGKRDAAAGVAASVRAAMAFSRQRRVGSRTR